MSSPCLWVAAVALLALFATSSSTPTKQRPNIIIMLADDLGWNDVSFHGSDQIPTPNIDALAYHGVILNNHYAPALCTPSRAALMTGKYPTHTGMQHLVILEPEPWGLPLSERILPQHLKRAGYATHAIGKWHLGFFKKEYTPTYRGFDSHFGYWNGFQDYYDHTVKATNSPFAGYDMRRNMSVDYSAAGKYSTDLYTEEAVSLIRRHDQSRGPLFLYLAHLAPHTGNQDNPFQAPDEEVAKFRHIRDPERRVYAAMVSRMDKSVGEVMAALRETGMLDNSIIVFMSDHGAPTHGIHSNRGSNWPFRGQKHSPWEGGVRAVAAVWSPLLKKTQRVSNQLMHMTDWLPTLYSAAGLDVRDLGRIDGVDMWPALSEGSPSPRSEVLHNIDDIYGYAALARAGWKYVTGSTGGAWDGWYGEPRRHGAQDSGATPPYDVAGVLASKTGVALAGFLTERQLLEKMAAATAGNTGGVEEQVSTQLLSEETVARLRHDAEVRCPPRRADNSSEAAQCRPMEAPCLFNLREDPCETVNLAAQHPLVLRSLQVRTSAALNVSVTKEVRIKGDGVIYAKRLLQLKPVRHLGGSGAVQADDGAAEQRAGGPSGEPRLLQQHVGAVAGHRGGPAAVPAEAQPHRQPGRRRHRLPGRRAGHHVRRAARLPQRAGPRQGGRQGARHLQHLGSSQGREDHEADVGEAFSGRGEEVTSTVGRTAVPKFEAVADSLTVPMFVFVYLCVWHHTASSLVTHSPRTQSTCHKQTSTSITFLLELRNFRKLSPLYSSSLMKKLCYVENRWKAL